MLNGAQDQPQPDASQLVEVPALEGSCPAALWEGTFCWCRQRSKKPTDQAEHTHLLVLVAVGFLFSLKSVF